MRIYRLGTRAYPVWDGTAAAAVGGRWNPVGLPVIYAAGSLALAMLERLVQRRSMGETLLIEANVPDDMAVEDMLGRCSQNPFPNGSTDPWFSAVLNPGGGCIWNHPFSDTGDGETDGRETPLTVSKLTTLTTLTSADGGTRCCRRPS